MEAQTARDIPDGLRPIDTAALSDALAVLERGFPERTRPFWEAGFARWDALIPDDGGRGPPGYILRAEGADVGVMLTFRSRRAGPDGAAYTQVNLSSWYLDAAHRWKAPMMLRRIVGDGQAVFTDLSPSPAVDRINAALGFDLWSDGTLIAGALPWAAMRSRRPARVLSLAESPAHLLAREEQALLERHAAIGCIAAVLHEAGSVSALLFRTTRIKRIPAAQLIYVDSRQRLIDHLPVVMRFLLARGIVLLSIDAVR
ncbi:MAG TPA: hypothetical protein VF641_00180, partial [Methylobacterium sp.]